MSDLKACPQVENEHTKEVVAAFVDKFNFHGVINYEETHHGETPFKMQDLIDAVEFGWNQSLFNKKALDEKLEKLAALSREIIDESDYDRWDKSEYKKEIDSIIKG